MRLLPQLTLLLFVNCFPLSLYSFYEDQEKMEKDTSNVAKWNTQAQEFMDSLQYDSALVYWKKAALQIDPSFINKTDTLLWSKYISINVKLARVLLITGQYQKAVSLLTGIEQKEQRSLELIVNI